MLYLGTGATFLAMVTAGSRAVIAESLQVVACFSFLAYFRPSEFGKITASVFGLSAIIVILYSQVDLFKEGISFLSLRFEEAANVEGNPIEAYFIRYWDIIQAPYQFNKWTSFFGNGLGSATRAGAALGGGYGGAELSWARPVMENGLLIGSFFLLIRCWVTKDLLINVHSKCKKRILFTYIYFWCSGSHFTFWATWTTYYSWFCIFRKWFMPSFS